MKPRSALIPKLTAIALCAINTVVLASSGRPVDITERIQGAQAIVVATALNVDARWDHNAAGDLLIMSRIALHVEETLKGRPFSSRLLDVEGGTLNGVTLHVSSLPDVKPGERAVVFLDENGSMVDAPHGKGLGILKLDAANRVVGSSLSVNDIRTLVHSAAGR
jgi:hypothetical protein